VGNFSAIFGRRKKTGPRGSIPSGEPTYLDWAFHWPTIEEGKAKKDESGERENNA